MADTPPLDAVYAAVARRLGAAWASRSVTAGTDGVAAERVMDPEWLADQILVRGARWGTPDGRVLGVLWWYSASTVVVGPALAGLAVTGAGLSSAPSHLVLHVAPDGRLLGAHSTAVAGDGPAAVGADLGANLAAMIGAVADVTSRGEAALWAIATDAVANQLAWIGQALGEVERVTGLAAPLVAAMDRPMPEPRYVDVLGRRFVDRVSCCLIYRLPGGGMCTSCPRRHPDDRRELLTRLAASG